MSLSGDKVGLSKLAYSSALLDVTPSNDWLFAGEACLMAHLMLYKHVSSVGDSNARPAH